MLKRSISNVATFEKVREDSAGKKYGKKYERIVQEKNAGKKYSKKGTGKKVRKKSTKKKVRGKSTKTKRKAGQGLFRSREFVNFGEKGPTRADIAQISVVHAHNILRTGPLPVTSGHFQSSMPTVSLPAAPPQSLLRKYGLNCAHI